MSVPPMTTRASRSVWIHQAASYACVMEHSSAHLMETNVTVSIYRVAYSQIMWGVFLYVVTTLFHKDYSSFIKSMFSLRLL